MSQKILASVLFVAVLSGCAAGVKLDDIPIEDRVPSSSAGVSTQGMGTSENNARSASSIADVQIQQTPSDIGPVGVPHVVYFDYDSFVVRPEARPVIESHARFLQRNKQRKANLEGHTDERGGREYNLSLGQKRAESVRQMLSLLGVDDTQIEAVSYGKEKPASLGADEADMAKNRRVEIRY